MFIRGIPYFFIFIILNNISETCRTIYYNAVLLLKFLNKIFINNIFLIWIQFAIITFKYVPKIESMANKISKIAKVFNSMNKMTWS